MEIAQCINNNITTIVPSYARKKQRKCYSTRIFVAQFQYKQTDDTYTCPQGEILKPQEDGTRKGRTEQSGYSRNTEHPLAKIVQ
jgi:hypothetical protein